MLAKISRLLKASSKGGAFCFARTCPQKAFCSHLCPEAEAYVSQDHQTAREFLSSPRRKYIARPEPRQKFASLSKTEWENLSAPQKKVSPIEHPQI